ATTTVVGADLTMHLLARPGREGNSARRRAPAPDAHGCNDGTRRRRLVCRSPCRRGRAARLDSPSPARARGAVPVVGHRLQPPGKRMEEHRTMRKATSQRVARVLLGAGVIGPEELALAGGPDGTEPLATRLVRLRLATEQQIAEALATEVRVPLVHITAAS